MTAAGHFRATPRRKRMTPGEEQWLEHFADEYGIQPSKRLAADNALRAYFPATRRQPTSEAQWQKLRTVFAKEDAAQ